MAIVLIQQLPERKKLSHPACYSGVVKDKNGNVLFDAYKGGRLELSAFPIVLDDDNEEDKKIIKVYEQLSGRLGGTSVWENLVDGARGQTHRIARPQQDAENQLAIQKRKIENTRKLYSLSEAEIKRFGIIFNIYGSVEVITMALTKMLETAVVADRLITFLEMNEDKFNIYVTISSALKVGDYTKGTGVYKRDEMYYYNGDPIGTSVDKCVEWLMTNENRIEILKGIKILIGEAQEAEPKSAKKSR
jgi:hypothetical protein